MHYAKDNRSISPDALFDGFCTPNLVAQVLSGESIKHPRSTSTRESPCPPLVTITSPESDQSFSDKSLDITIRVQDQGGGIQDIRLHHNDKLVGTEQHGIKKTEQRQDVQLRTVS